MSQWKIYTGHANPHKPELPAAPPWRRFPADLDAGSAFMATEEMAEAVNAALHLRRPLLLTGRAGSGKSSLIDSVARELRLGRVLRWHVTSSTTLTEALYRYDAIGRLHSRGLEKDPNASPPPISEYLRLGPLGTALVPGSRPRALLIDEIDKSDIDLPNDLLNIFERGEFEIPELARHNERWVDIPGHDEKDTSYRIERGQVQCTEFPFVVLTSNGERDFPAAFLRRCIRLRMPDPGLEELTAIVRAHLGDAVFKDGKTAIEVQILDFIQRRKHSEVATDQLLNAIYLVTGPFRAEGDERNKIIDLLLSELKSDTVTDRTPPQ
ncbi:hypothetical protein AU252_11460 [Pseudarthrobacter sulfonivorans]|uniref:AAA+ ATPase domain-containing protein n=1 Tax=Pseudarthrobacter sulfonivorans TaxID=121292 RepID=A0A0U3QJH7_9MICC|nr:MoxR family ATPase [Pseudarthrobacter sulfonivorans]ALV41691.1 hypothetical protein AU252_11460 [Pseudarthrobacter sulfonivorans]